MPRAPKRKRWGVAATPNPVPEQRHWRSVQSCTDSTERSARNVQLLVCLQEVKQGGIQTDGGTESVV